MRSRGGGGRRVVGGCGRRGPAGARIQDRRLAARGRGFYARATNASRTGRPIGCGSGLGWTRKRPRLGVRADPPGRPKAGRLSAGEKPAPSAEQGSLASELEATPLSGGHARRVVVIRAPERGPWFGEPCAPAPRSRAWARGRSGILATTSRGPPLEFRAEPLLRRAAKRATTCSRARRPAVSARPRPRLACGFPSKLRKRAARGADSASSDRRKRRARVRPAPGKQTRQQPGKQSRRAAAGEGGARRLREGARSQPPPRARELAGPTPPTLGPLISAPCAP